MPKWAGVAGAIGYGLSVESVTFEAVGFDCGARAGLAVDGAAEDIACGFGSRLDAGLAFCFDLVWCKHKAN